MIMEETPQPCRCGHEGEGPHPCHARFYMCRKPATQRFYGARPAPLAGAQLKFVAQETWACDECWAASEFNRQQG